MREEGIVVNVNNDYSRLERKDGKQYQTIAEHWSDYEESQPYRGL